MENFFRPGRSIIKS